MQSLAAPDRRVGATCLERGSRLVASSGALEAILAVIFSSASTTPRLRDRRSIAAICWARDARRLHAARGRARRSSIVADLRRPLGSSLAVLRSPSDSRDLLDPRPLPAAALPAIGARCSRSLYPFFATKMFTIPIFGAWPDVATGVYMLVFMMMAVGLNIVVGYAGLLDLGYVAFYAMGAYTAAWFASLQFAHANVHFGAVGDRPERCPGIHISIWLAARRSPGSITALVGIVIGLPTLRLRGDYLAIVTLGFGEILPQIARNGDNLFGTGFNLTNGPNGITPIDSPGFGHTLSQLDRRLPAGELPECCNATCSAPDPVDRLFFWTAIVLLLITVFCSLRLRDSRLGRAWIAIREDETAAAAMGVPLMRTKTWAYATGAFFGGVAGAYYASFKSATFPGDFFFNISVFILCMVILGGMGNVWGVIVGAAFLAYLDQEGLANTGAWINEHPLRQLPPEPRRADVRVRHLRRDHPGRDALPAGGPDPVDDDAQPSCTRACTTSRSTTSTHEGPRCR